MNRDATPLSLSRRVCGKCRTKKDDIKKTKTKQDRVVSQFWTLCSARLHMCGGRSLRGAAARKLALPAGAFAGGKFAPPPSEDSRRNLWQNNSCFPLPQTDRYAPGWHGARLFGAGGWACVIEETSVPEHTRDWKAGPMPCPPGAFALIKD